MTELVIFDLDGTLLNTIEDLGRACNHALRMCGFPERPVGAYSGMVGRGIANMFRAALPEGEGSEENIGRMRQFFLPFYDAHKCDCTKPYEGIPELLHALAERGVKMGVASNKYQAGAEQLMEHFFGDLPFEKILGQREGHPIKPDPEIVMEIMQAARVSGKSGVLYVGDSNVDMQTGLNAGVRTVGVSWGFRPRSELAAFRPWKIVDKSFELRDLILGK